MNSKSLRLLYVGLWLTLPSPLMAQTQPQPAADSSPLLTAPAPHFHFSASQVRFLLDTEIGDERGLGFQYPHFAFGATLELPVGDHFEFQNFFSIAAAHLLGIGRSTLYRKLNEYLGLPSKVRMDVDGNH